MTGAEQAAPAGQDQDQDAGPEYRGWVIIEWPQARPAGIDYPAGAFLPAWGLTLYDAMTGRALCTVSKVVINAAVDNIITADLTMMATPEGDPVPAPGPGQKTAIYPDTETGGFLEGTFTYLVAAMRVRGTVPAGAGGGGTPGTAGCTGNSVGGAGGGGGGGGSVYGPGGRGGDGGNAGACGGGTGG